MYNLTESFFKYLNHGYKQALWLIHLFNLSFSLLVFLQIIIKIGFPHYLSFEFDYLNISAKFLF